MTQIEPKSANAVAKQDPDGWNSSSEFIPRDTHRLSNANPQDILERIAQGELIREVAKDYGVSQPAVSQFIAKHVPKETWARVRELSIAARLERSTEAIESAADQLILARAREAARLWMWRAEREMPHLYGAKPSTAIQVNGTDGTQVQIVSYANPTPQLPDDGE